MAEKVDECCTLVRAFTDFDLMPDLLVRTIGSASAPGVGPSIVHDEGAVLERWESFLADAHPNIDHAEPEDLPQGVALERFLAEDVLRLSRRLGLLTATAVNASSLRLVDVGKQPTYDRDDEDYRAIQETLSGAVREHYVGADGLAVLPLLIEGARRLAETDHVWASYVPGLLLVEFEALIYWAFTRPERGRRLCDEMVTYRELLFPALVQ